MGASRAETRRKSVGGGSAGIGRCGGTEDGFAEGGGQGESLSQ